MPVSHGHNHIKIMTGDHQYFGMGESFYYRPTKCSPVIGIYKTTLIEDESNFCCSNECDLWEWCSNKYHTDREGNEEKYDIPVCTMSGRVDSMPVKFIKL